MEKLGWLSSFAGKDGVPLLLVLFFTLVIVFIYIRKGYFSFNAHGIRVGQDISTRNLIQSQFTYAKAKVEGLVSVWQCKDNIHTKYVLARVEDVVQKAIVFNNMTTNESYVRSYQELIYQTIMKRADGEEYFLQSSFKQSIYDFTRELITELVRMKDSF